MTSIHVRAGRSAPRRRSSRLAKAFVAASLALTGLTAVSAQAADTGSISGTVFTKAVGGNPVPAKSVYIYLSYSATVDGFYDSVDSDPSTSGTDGYSFSGSTFTLKALKAGFYKFEVAGVGDSAYLREYYDGADGTQDLSAATPIQVSTNAAVTGKNSTLEPAGQISGVVRDAAGKPLANASVMFERTQFGGSSGVTTDAQGRYTSASVFGGGLVRGPVRVVASQWGSIDNPDAPSYVSEYWKEATTFATATPVTVTPGATTQNIDFTLAVAPRIRLTVKDPAGRPVKNADVGIWTFYDGKWGPYQAGPNETDANGIYRKTVSVGDRYKFFINPPAGVGGVMEWYDNAYTEQTAKVVSATSAGQLVDITIQLGAAPSTPTPTTPTPTVPTPTAPAPTAPAPAPAAPAPKAMKSSAVSIKGTARVGRTLRASTRAWAPAPVQLSYTWYRNGKVVKGQSRSTYKLRTADKGKRITVRVHQRKASYVTANRLSGKTAKVKKR
jgi:protocatechuate 3,4-dioxygenase beta subunit